jgi:hypothetical protein
MVVSVGVDLHAGGRRNRCPMACGETGGRLPFWARIRWKRRPPMPALIS